MVLYKTVYSSPIGDMSLVADEKSLLGAWFINQKYFEKGIQYEQLRQSQQQPILEASKSWLDAYFSGQNPPLPDFLATKGTAFQECVWQHLKEIPQGQTTTYGDIASAINCQSAQAVGGAVGKNPLSIFVPCHRVLGSNGQLTGYAGGLDKKIWLLEHETRSSNDNFL